MSLACVSPPVYSCLQASCCFQERTYPSKLVNFIGLSFDGRLHYKPLRGQPSTETSRLSKSSRIFSRYLLPVHLPTLYDVLVSAGNRYSHASGFARIMEDGLARNLLQVKFSIEPDQEHDYFLRAPHGIGAPSCAWYSD
jgi:hypothetical protein